MAVFKDTIMIHDGRGERAVQVTIDAPEGVSVVNLQELAERAWRAPGKSVTVGQVTVRCGRSAARTE